MQVDLLTRQDVDRLIDESHGHCVSIYVPTHRSNSDKNLNKIRFKNQVNEAQRQLSELGLREKELQKLLAPTQELLMNDYFWLHQADSLAVFLNEDAFHYYRLPIQTEEFTDVNNRFYVKPLIPLLSEDGTFFLLHLTKGFVRCTAVHVIPFRNWIWVMRRKA